MYKVWQIADGMIIWKGNAVIGIKGLTLPEMFLDCDCYKLPGNAFDYALSPNNKYTEEQLAFINKAVDEWQDPAELVEVEHSDEHSPASEDEEHEWPGGELPDDELPF